MNVVWVTPKRELQEGPEGVSSHVASVRYRALIPARALTARGHQASVVGLDRECFDSARDRIAGADCAVFRKNYGEAEYSLQLMQEMQARGVRTLFDISDDRFLAKPGPDLLKMIAQAGSVVSASTLLQEVVKQHTGRDSFVVSDPYEGARGEPRWSPAGPRLKVLWFGHGTNLDSLQQAFHALLQAGAKHPMDLRIVTKGVGGIERNCKQFNSEYRQTLSLRYAEWSSAETWNSLAAADFVVIPVQPGERWTLTKSPNRIIESLWAGRFVVAHPIPSYMEFKEWAWIGENLAEGIGWMVDNGPLIVDRIRSAQEYISSVYSPERIASEWEKVLEKA